MYSLYGSQSGIPDNGLMLTNHAVFNKGFCVDSVIVRPDLDGWNDNSRKRTLEICLKVRVKVSLCRIKSPHFDISLTCLFKYMMRQNESDDV